MNIPDLAPYYPSTYYSLTQGDSSRRNWTETLTSFVVQETHGKRFMRLFRRFNIPLRRDLSILDVGSGSGKLLDALRRRGFQKLTGADPYLSESSQHDCVRLLKARIEEVDERFDLIIFNHSLEHVTDLDRTLRAAHALLSNGGSVIVRIPMPNYAWRRYGVCWAGLDAPRHINLLTPRGLEIVGRRAGFSVRKCMYDSAPSQFWASEAYVRGETLDRAVPSALFPLALHVLGRVRWLWQARALNRRGLGDQASFLLTPHGD